MVRRIGGGILAVVAVAVPIVFDKMSVQLSAEQGIALLAVCAVLAVIGLALVFWPDRKAGNSTPGVDKSVTSHNQSGGITAWDVNTPDGQG